MESLGDLRYKIPKLRWLPVRHWYDLRNAMSFTARVRDPVDGIRYAFCCDSFQSYQRGKSFLDKEPETIAWLRASLRPDDVFLDIGANIGVFTIFAGKHIGPQGHVYACEPHLANAAQLLQNIVAHGLQDRVSALSIAISGQDGFVPFRYRRWEHGDSGGQLQVTGAPGMKTTVGTEYKMTMTVDSMIERGIIRSPNLIKVDTDGVEIPIARGMERLLRSERRPRAILMEVQQGQYSEQTALLASFGYKHAETHIAGRWARPRYAGAKLDEIAFNALYVPDA
jgi:FkbM family methyltransferase